MINMLTKPEFADPSKPLELKIESLGFSSDDLGSEITEIQVKPQVHHLLLPLVKVHIYALGANDSQTYTITNTVGNEVPFKVLRMENNNDGYKQFRITIEDENLRNATTVNGQGLYGSDPNNIQILNLSNTKPSIVTNGQTIILGSVTTGESSGAIIPFGNISSADTTVLGVCWFNWCIRRNW